MRLTLIFIIITSCLQAQNPDTTDLQYKNVLKDSIAKPPVIYMLAGLGLDPRAFEKLKVNADTSLLSKDKNIYYLDWIDPLPREKIEAYAKRLIAAQMDTMHQKAPLLLIGHSFGGVMMQEIARQLPQVEKIILISSIHTHKEKPGMLRIFGWLPTYWMISKGMIKGSFPLWAKKYGYKSKESRKLFRSMVSRFSNRYHRWATRTITRWRPAPWPAGIPIIRIHGSKDRMFPIRRIQNPDYIIEGGNHFMIWEDAVEVNKVLIKGANKK